MNEISNELSTFLLEISSVAGLVKGQQFIQVVDKLTEIITGKSIYDFGSTFSLSLTLIHINK